MALSPEKRKAVCCAAGLRGLRMLREGLSHGRPGDQPWPVSHRSMRDKCVGCGKCAKECPASVIEIQEVNGMKKKWYDYLWIASLAYLVLGFLQHPLCVAGTAVLLYSAADLHR